MNSRLGVGATPGTRFTRAWRDGGLRSALGKAVRVLCAPVLEAGSVRFYSKGVDAAPPAAHPRRDIEIEQATKAMADQLLMDRADRERVAAEIQQRFARGDRCVVARDRGGRVVHTRWLATGPTHIPELGRYVVPVDGQWYMYDGYTRADARGQGVDGAVRAAVFRLAQAAGAHEVISYVLGSNRPGLKAAEKWQRPLGQIRFVRVFGTWSLVFGRRRVDGRAALMSGAQIERETQLHAVRADALKSWFESWLSEPAQKHSTGYSALPDAYFLSAAGHIVETLKLDPASDEVLDVGCSSAVLSRHVAPSCRRFTGVDATEGLVAAIKPGSVRTASGEAAAFLAADGRHLPFPSGSFSKVYCTGVIHMLPSQDDALKVVDECIRVCRPGGDVLLGAVPDVAKRAADRRLRWRRAGLNGKLKIVAAALTPRPMRRALRTLRITPGFALTFLEFDMRELRARYEARGFRCQLLDYSDDYWSEDFRTTRTNLLITRAAAGEAVSKEQAQAAR